MMHKYSPDVSTCLGYIHVSCWPKGINALCGSRLHLRRIQNYWDDSLPETLLNFGIKVLFKFRYNSGGQFLIHQRIEVFLLYWFLVTLDYKTVKEDTFECACTVISKWSILNNCLLCISTRDKGFFKSSLITKVVSCWIIARGIPCTKPSAHQELNQSLFSQF